MFRTSFFNRQSGSRLLVEKSSLENSGLQLQTLPVCLCMCNSSNLCCILWMHHMYTGKLDTKRQLTFAIWNGNRISWVLQHSGLYKIISKALKIFCHKSLSGYVNKNSTAHWCSLYMNEELLFSCLSKWHNNTQLGGIDGTPLCNNSQCLIEAIHCISPTQNSYTMLVCSVAVSPWMKHMVNRRYYLPMTGKAMGCMWW